MNIGIVTGLDAEADAFLPGMGSAVSRSPAMPLAVRSLAHAGHDITLACAGIGKVNAAMAATWLVGRGAVLLLVIGTAGKLSAIAGDTFWLGEAVQHDYGAMRPQGFAHFSAGSWPLGEAAIEAHVAMKDPGLGLPHARIATGDAFVECPDRSLRIVTDLSADLVDMETAAVAQVADAFSLPWAAIKATTDEADGDSAGNFMANLAAAARRAGKAAERLVAMQSDSTG